MAKSIMFVGTNSSAGKSFFATAMCRVLSDCGYKVSPFKSQNMALNSYIDDNGLEFGRAQAIQSFAARKIPDARMNPVLLKPTSDKKSEVVLIGKKVDLYDAKKYYQVKSKYIPYIKKAYYELSCEVDVMVLEGAGSPAEINLLDNDFVNMGMSEIAKAPVILVADIDKGGVFASIYGTVMLTPEKWRKNYKGIIINKFRGEKSILDSGIEQIEKMLDIPIISVMPYIDIDIEEEDSLTNRLRKTPLTSQGVNITILKLPNLSNFTEFSPLNAIDDVNVNYIRCDEKIPQSTDLLIIPASKNIFDDLNIINSTNMGEDIKMFSKCGKILCIGNGLELLCKKIDDKANIYSNGDCVNALGLFDATICTSSQYVAKKTLKIFNKKNLLENVPDEIIISFIKKGVIFSDDYIMKLNDEIVGVQNNNCIGIYGFSIFENADFVNAILNNIRDKKGLEKKSKSLNYSEYRENQIVKLASEFKKYVDVDKLMKIIYEGI